MLSTVSVTYIDVPSTFVPNWRSYPSAVNCSIGGTKTPLFIIIEGYEIFCSGDVMV